jgi:hypothetical protein
MNEQNHKISSMLGLVSTMADELNMVKARLQMGIQAQAPANLYGELPEGHTAQHDLLKGAGAVREDDNSLISVSDDSEEGSEEDSEDGSEEGSEDESEEGSEEEDEEDLQESAAFNDVKVINMGSENAQETEGVEEVHSFDIDEEDDDEEDDDEEDDDEDDEDEDDEDDESDAIDLANELDIEEITAEPVLDNGEVKLSDQILMDVDPVADLETSTKEVPFPVMDFKKMTLPKLKEYVKQNGLIEQPNKMKKGEIIEFLENM